MAEAQGTDFHGSNTKGSDTQGSDTKGSDTKGSDTKGSDTVGSGAAKATVAAQPAASSIDMKGSDPIGANIKGADTVGADTMGAAAEKPHREAGYRIAGTVDGIYEDPMDFHTMRKLKQIFKFAGVNVDVNAAKQVAVDVSAPFTQVSVHKEASPNTRKPLQSVNVAGVDVKVAKVASALAVDVTAPLTQVCRSDTCKLVTHSFIHVGPAGVAHMRSACCALHCRTFTKTLEGPSVQPSSVNWNGP